MQPNTRKLALMAVSSVLIAGLCSCNRPRSNESEPDIPSEADVADVASAPPSQQNPGAPSAAGWFHYENSQGGYSVDMPGQPSEFVEQMPAPGGRSTELKVAIFKRGPVDIYLVSHAALVRGEDAQKQLEGIRDRLLTRPGSLVTSDEPGQLQGHPSRTLTITVADTMEQVVRLVLTEDRVFQISSMRSPGTPDRDGRRFVDSFALSSQ